MPQRLHSEWGGFDRLFPVDSAGKKMPNKPAFARCRTCGKTLHNVKSHIMRRHRLQCNQNALSSNEGESSPTGNSQSDVSRQSFTSNRSDSMSENSSDSSSNPASTTPTLDLDNDPQGEPVRSPRESYLSSNLSLEASLVEPPRPRQRGSNKRRRIDSVEDETEATEDEKAVELYKYFISSNTPFEHIEFPPFVKLLKTCDAKFPIPSTAEELRNGVGLKAADSIYRMNHNKKHTKILQLLVEIIDGGETVGDEGEVVRLPDTVLAVTLMGSMKGSWTFIKRLKFIDNHTGDITQKFDEFCDRSVLQAKNEYDTDVLFVLHDGKFPLKEVSKITFDDGKIHTYYKLCEAIAMMQKINCNLVCNGTNFDAISKFYNQLKSTIPDAIVSEKLTMSVAMGRLFEAIDCLDADNKEIVSRRILEIISPLHLSAKVFHPQLHSKFMTSPVFKLFTTFQMAAGPKEIANLVPYYLSKSGGCFTILYDQGSEANPEYFWDAVRLDRDMENIDILSDYALQMTRIPATLKFLDLQGMFQKRSSYTEQMQDFDNVFFSVLLE